MVKKLNKIDWSEVEGLAENYISDLKRKDITGDELNDYDDYIFESVIEAVFGKEIWDEINPVLNNL